MVGFLLLLLPDALHFEVLTDPHQLDALALGFRVGRPRCRCWLGGVCGMASVVELAVEHAPSGELSVVALEVQDCTADDAREQGGGADGRQRGGERRVE